jgi:hypothetical protein
MKFKKGGKVYESPNAIAWEYCENKRKRGICPTYAKKCPMNGGGAFCEVLSCKPEDTWLAPEKLDFTQKEMGFEVIEDDTPSVAEVVEKYGEDVKRRLTRADILHAAEKCVCGQRETDYGTPEDNFKTIAELWEAYLNKACTRGVNVRVEAKDVAVMMALLKIARIAAGGGKADSWIDLAGYAACGAECEGVTE